MYSALCTLKLDFPTEVPTVTDIQSKTWYFVFIYLFICLIRRLAFEAVI